MNSPYRLGDLFFLQMGKTPSRTNTVYWNGTVPWITVADLGTYDKFTGETKEHITELAVQESKMHRIPKDTVIMSFKLTLGRTAITSEDIYTNEAVMAFLPKENDVISADYFYHFCKNKKWQSEVNHAVLGMTLNKTALSEIKITLPDLAEQTKIAAKLDKTESLIHMHKAYLQELDQMIEAEFHHHFYKYYESGNANQPLSALCHFLDYRGRTPEKSAEGIPLITAKNVRQHEFVSEPTVYIPENHYDTVMTRGFPKINDVLFTTEAPLGNVCRIPVMEGKFCIGQRIITLQPKDCILSEYLEYALTRREFQNQVREKTTGSTVKGIRKKSLESLQIPLPSIVEQTKFANIVIQAERMKHTIKNTLDELERLKKSLIQAYFG